MTKVPKPIVLAAATIVLCGASADYRLVPMPQTVMPIAGGTELGTERVAKKDDYLLAGDLYDTFAAKLVQPISFSIRGEAVTLQPDDNVIPFLPTPDMTRAIGLSGRIFCGPALGQELSGLSKFQKAIGATYTTRTHRPCVVDVDENGTVEKGFVFGWGKEKDGVQIVDVPPTAYTIENLKRDAQGGQLKIRLYDVRGSSNRVVMLVGIKNRDGTNIGMTFYSSIEDGKVIKKSTYLESDPKKPYPFVLDGILGASLTILSADSKSKSLRYRIDHDFKRAIFAPGFVPPPQVIYIYH